MNSVTFRRNASEEICILKIEGHTTKVDMSPMTRNEKADFVGALFAWAKSGYIGYPDIRRD